MDTADGMDWLAKRLEGKVFTAAFCLRSTRELVFQLVIRIFEPIKFYYHGHEKMSSICRLDRSGHFL